VAGEALLTRRAVAVTRATRADPDVRFGSSVRGAIDLVEVAGRLAPLRSVDPDDPDVGLDAALVALTGRIRTHEGGDHNAEDVVQRLWAAVLSGRLDDEDHESASSRGGREGKAGAPVGATARRA
ncbi:MAG: MoxR family ATPase, partial [Acidimicrobiales bacterium]